MKKNSAAVLVALSIGGVALAQDVPKAELFLGYNYVRVNSTSTVSSFSSNGGSGQVAINFSKYVSGVFDLGGYHTGSLTDTRSTIPSSATCSDLA